MIPLHRVEPQQCSAAGRAIADCATVLQCASSFPWGWLSDRIGRKPVILSGTAATAISVAVFGFSWNYPMAVSIRASGGFMNGIIGMPWKWHIPYTFAALDYLAG